MNRVMVQPNPIKEEAVQVSRKLVSLLLREKFEVLALEEFRQVLCDGLEAHEAAQVRFMKAPEIYPACDFIMVVGGDGTILRIAPDASLFRKPVLGVNCEISRRLTRRAASFVGLGCTITRFIIQHFLYVRE